MLLMKYINYEKINNKTVADLDISGSVFEAMKNEIVLLEPTSWNSNQYSRHKFLKMSEFS